MIISPQWDKSFVSLVGCMAFPSAGFVSSLFWLFVGMDSIEVSVLADGRLLLSSGSSSMTVERIG
jgi:hypothetical protein